jgi:hypothetical protein
LRSSWEYLRVHQHGSLRYDQELERSKNFSRTQLFENYKAKAEKNYLIMEEARVIKRVLYKQRLQVEPAQPP